MSRLRRLAASGAATAVVLVALPGSTVGGQEAGGPTAPEGDPPAAQDGTPAAAPDPNDPFDGLDLSDPLVARLEVQRRLGESAAATEVVAGLVQVARTELDAARQRSAAADEWLRTALVQASDARERVVRAERDAESAREQAVAARAEARDALVDAYMNPPATDAARASMALGLDDVNESSFAYGLLSSRATNLTQVVEAAEEAEDDAEQAEAVANRAVGAADAAAAEATAAVESASAASEETGRRLADLELFESLVAAQVTSLTLVDAILVRVAEQRELTDATAGGPPVPASEVSAIGGTNIRVHRSVVDSVSAMILSAAADGLLLNGYAWRTVEAQIELRRAHCGTEPAQIFLAPASSCSPPTARPGSSMHERGLAIDFDDCASRETPCYQWLALHAHRFGFYNLPSEPWHWSVNGN